MALSASEIYEAWPLLSDEECLDGFRLLSRADGEKLFLSLDTPDQSELLRLLPEDERQTWMRLLQPDDATDVIQEAEEEERPQLLEMLDKRGQAEVRDLLAYEEDEAGGLMNPRYAALRPKMRVDDAIRYVRGQPPERIESMYYGYVLAEDARLLGVVSLRDLVTASGDRLLGNVMTTDPVTVTEGVDQETVSHLFAQHDLVAIPVVDDDGRMKGIVTVDDIVDVVREEATEDIHKIGGTEALDAPYLDVSIPELLTKRLGWLAVMLLLEVLAVTAMSRFGDLLAKATALALFVPMIIASGGNAGSQAATLVVRAMALNEVGLHDWWRVIRRELAVGIVMGAVLGVLGLAIVLSWHYGAVKFAGTDGFGPDHWLLAATIASSVVMVALWGTIAGSMLPFLLRGLGFDPASASTPLIATIVDASGLIIYLSIALALLQGTLV